VRCYVDSSVILRLLFGEPNPLREWKKVELAYSSQLTRVEIGRTIDCARMLGRIDDAQVATAKQEAERLLRTIHLVHITTPIVRTAAGAMPTVLRSLDGLHLATATSLRISRREPEIVATHDGTLATAARASGFEVVGVEH
jgi:uncharacterized protein